VFFLFSVFPFLFFFFGRVHQLLKKIRNSELAKRNFKTVNIRGEKKYYMKQNQKMGHGKNGEILLFKGGKT